MLISGDHAQNFQTVMMYMQKPSTFVASLALKDFRRVHLQTNICEVNREHRSNIYTRWRCCVNEAMGQKEISDRSNEDNGILPETSDSTETFDISHEGPLSSNSLDSNFEDALSKDWDRLMNFDHENLPREPVITAEETNSAPNAVAKILPDAHEEQSTLSVEGENTIVGSNGSVVGKKLKGKKQTGIKSKASKTENKSDTAKSKPRKVAKGSKRNAQKAGMGIGDGEERNAVPVEWSRDPHWYFVQVKPGCERHVAQSIRNLAISLENDEIVDVFVPMTTVVHLSKGGIYTKKDERYFPGYTLVLMIMNEETYGHVLRVPHVQCFMGDANRKKDKGEPFRPPIPLTDEEMKSMFDKLRTEDDVPIEKKMVFSPGDPVRVVSGSMEGSTGKVVAVTPDLDIVKCSLVVFGTETKVELNTKQLEAYDGVPVDDENALDDKREMENRQDRTSRARRRVDSMFSGDKNTTAGVASAADDLAALLATDESDDWDPLQGQTSSQKQGKARRLNEPAMVSNKGTDIDDGFTSVNMEDDEPDMDENYNQSPMPEELDDDGFTSATTTPSQVSQDYPWDVQDDYDGKEPSLSKKTRVDQAESERAAWSEKDLDSYLDGGDINDLWDAKDDPSDEQDVKQGSKGKREEKAEEFNEEFLFSEAAADKNFGKNISTLLKEIDEEMRDEDLDSDGNDLDDTDLFGVDDEIFNFEHQLPNNQAGNDTTPDEPASKQFSNLSERKAERQWRERRMKMRQKREEADDNDYMMMLPPDNLEDIENLEPIVRVEGEENFVKVDFTDSPPSMGIDYDEVVAKERAEKNRLETDSAPQKKPSGGRQSMGKKSGRPRGRPRKNN